MNNFEVIKNMCKYNADGSVDIEILHEKLGKLPFTATKDDHEEHGRLLYQKALAGEYGDIAPYVPPPPPTDEELSLWVKKEREYLLTTLVDPFVSNPLRWGDLSQVQKDNVTAYRKELLDITLQPGFPKEVTWPVVPTVLSKD